MIVCVDLFRQFSEEDALVANVYFSVDDLLTADEVRTKVLRVASILVGPVGQMELDFRSPAEKEFIAMSPTPPRWVQ